MPSPQTDYAMQRRNMVESQLRPNKVTDERILVAMERLPREFFVPAEAAAMSYCDEDIALGGGRYLMEPMLLARMTQEAAITSHERVLEIGCGTGYGTALLASLCGHVTALDIDSGLLAKAAANLRQLGLQAQLHAAPFARGLPEQGPYDVIIISGAVAEVSDHWLTQLAEGGRMLVVVRTGNTVVQNGVARLYLKTGGQTSWQPLFDAQTPYLPGLAPQPRFVF